jgi:hypothetical protein
MLGKTNLIQSRAGSEIPEAQANLKIGPLPNKYILTLLIYKYFLSLEINSILKIY